MVHTERMDLSRPLATVLPAIDAGAIAVLAGTEAPLTGRQVAELAGESSHPSTLRALLRLAAQGLVLVEPAGRANLYRLNRDHLLVPALLEIASADTLLRSRLADSISSWQVPALHASLYGSVARGDASTTSDLDVLVVRPEGLATSDRQAWENQLSDLERRAFSWTGNPLSWLETTPTDLRRAGEAGEPLFQSWRDDAILLTGQSLSSLMRAPQTPRRT